VNLRDALTVLRKRALLIAAATIVCAGVALAGSMATKPTYSASAELLVVAKTSSAKGEEVSSAYEGALLSQQLVKSLAQVLRSRQTAELALKLRPEAMSAAQLQSQVTVEPILDTLVIDLHVTDTDPARAQRLANNLSAAFIQQVPNLQGGSALQVSVIEPALVPTAPVSPNTRLNVMLGLVIGLLVGVAAAVAAEQLDTSVRTAERLEGAVGAPMLGMIPAFDAAAEPLAIQRQPHAIQAEAFRKLRANFSFLGVGGQGICCAVTSSTSALALALAQAGQRVIVVDTDLRRPYVHKLFGLQQEVGTTTVLLDRIKLDEALQWPEPNLGVLTSGPIPPNPSELLGSEPMANLIADLRTQADVVLLDCPPVLPVADPVVVSRFTDGVLIVAHGRATSRAQVQLTASTCRQAGLPILGTSAA
jgi:polysaccharide biosynthesis transport protein